MIKGGYVLLPRILLESDIYKTTPCVREVWLYLIINAAYKPTKNLKRGQIRTNFSKISEDLSWKVGYRKMKYSNKQCERAANVLVKVGAIVATKVVHGMLITICNYDTYQEPDNYESRNESRNEGDCGQPQGVVMKTRRKEGNYNTLVRISEKKLKNGKTEINGGSGEWGSFYAGRYGASLPEVVGNKKNDC